ncbi:wall-associated receptor kinase 5-like [Impatiens glandulifera]|uniref:wall-associated receptor kinase 5-like n=1 Tax=Impatiens glandulifera TaxID=253017 RepID=UPI001FB13A94|nr:wall-associated receptor kinase 5-like [Impatiens glandulifera]
MSLCNSINDTTDGTCSGIGCCEASIPKRVKSFEIIVRSYNEHSSVESFNPCSYGFVAEQGTYTFSSNVLGNSFALTNVTHPMILEWSIGNSNCDQAKINATTYACKDNTNCQDFDNGIGYQCNCSNGYQGNPYLGCTDIDECELSRPCNMTCTNLPGTYKCSCPYGYEGDGEKNPGSSGCRRIPKNKVPWNNIALGVSISISCLLLGASWIYWAFRKRKIIKLKEKFFEQNGGIMLRQQLFNPEGEAQNTTRRSSNIFGEDELKKATSNYHESRILGQGGQGTVYKGVLTNDTIVAIKKSKQVDKTQIDQFINEVIIITQINHRNVVKLIGCCLETEVPMLVYEYVSNGTLYDHIQQGDHKRPLLSWTNRLRIATETAGALSYLHGAASIPIIHRDIKSTNILLDENYTAKVSDFGASRLIPMNQTQLTTLVQGTLGYLDPEYFHSSQLTEKSDVYSFGVLLIELMTSKKALDYERPEKERNLANYFIASFKEDCWHEIVDQKMIEESSEYNQLYEVAKLAIQCLKLQGDERPTMKEVAMELEGLRIIHNHSWSWRNHHHNDHYNPEEVEGLLVHEVPDHNSYEESTIYSANYDTMRNHAITPLEVPIIAQTQPGCLDRCGDISIPYPFGVREGCFLDSAFLVTCNETTNKLFLGSIEIVDISIFGELRVLSWIGSDCYKNNISDGWIRPWLTAGTSFYVSSLKNKFVALGCDTNAVITGTQGQRYTTGCMSLCNSMDEITNGTCLGIGCCEASIPKRVQSFEIQVTSYDNHSFVESFNPCSYGFVAEQGTYTFSTEDLGNSFLLINDTSRMVLEWSVGNTTCEQAKTAPLLSTYACKDNTNCHNFDNGIGYQCNCSNGYQGNPYLGCTDIDECEVLRPCNMTCTNSPGSYKCSCPPGYEGDGETHLGSSGCRRIPKKKIPWNNIVLDNAGVSISISGLLLGASWIYWAFRKRKIIKLKEKFFEQNGGIMLRQQLFKPEGEAQNTTRHSSNIFGEEELKKATSNYHESRVLGQGGQGTVYKGVLTNDTIVAIKKSKQVDKTQIEQFINEVIIITQINHRNVVKLIGCCLETEVPMLVYEYVSNGTLYDHIQQGDHKRPLLSWTNRLRIATETAGALSYLHGAASIPIIHRDIKSTNILLDENYTAKVSDFGASRLIPMNQTQLTTMVQGTLGYLDPEYFHSSQLTEKSDVYSFGVLLIELMTSKKALDYERPEKQRNLATYFIASFKEDRWHDIVDQKMIDDSTEYNHLYEVAKLAMHCLKLQGDERPTMKEVAMELEGLRIMQNHPWKNHHHDQNNLEEGEGLLGHVVPDHNISTTISSASYDTMRNHVITPSLEGGR